ncbi:MAG: C40 family peptidase, partial [Neisseria sp.]|nr:C40 family peptidase [Neisseria sp.]
MKYPLIISLLASVMLAACGTNSAPKANKTRATQTAKTIQIRHIAQDAAGQELMLNAMDLVGTPYRWGGADDATGFDCSGMIQFVYKNALGVNLPRTSSQMAAASRSIKPNALKTGDLVFFNTSGKGISHVGLYLGNGEFLHAPRSGSTVQTEKLSNP